MKQCLFAAPRRVALFVVVGSNFLLQMDVFQNLRKAKIRAMSEKYTILSNNIFLLPSYSANHHMILGSHTLVSTAIYLWRRNNKGHNIGQCNKYFIAFYNAIVNN